MRVPMKVLRAKCYEKVLGLLGYTKESLIDSVRYEVMKHYVGGINTYKFWGATDSWYEGMNIVAEYHIGSRENVQLYKRAFDTYYRWLWSDFTTALGISDKTELNCLLSCGLSEDISENTSLLRFYNAILAIGVLFKAESNIKDTSDVLDMFMADDYNSFMRILRGCLECLK